MVWTKVKNIMILILVLLNLCLLLLIAGQRLQSAHYEEETLRQTQEVLALNGIAVDRDILPGTMELPALTLTRDEEREKRTVAFLLGEDAVFTGGGSMSIYTSDVGNLSFYGGGALVGDLALNWREKGAAAEVEDILLAGLGIEAWSITSGETGTTVIPLLNGVPVFNCTLSFNLEGETLVGIEGRIPGLSTPEKEQPAPISVPTALVSLLEYVVESGTVCRSIQSMTPGYYVASAGTDSARLSPCWLVRTDTVAFYIDALDGEVIRAD